ncbi:MAG TPA: hypothetical protein VID26_03315 [Candidatus Limnocylindrales bacterium]|jgi:hypothetical protein
MNSGPAATPGFFGSSRAELGPRSSQGPIWAALTMVVGFAVFLASNRNFDAGRGDFFYLADAFLHGRTWLTAALGPYDNVVIGDHVYVPFGPFPAFVLMPLVALFGPVQSDIWQPIVNAALAAIDLGLCWWLAARVGVRQMIDRAWLVILFGFSTQVWWVTTRGGVWHTGHLVASGLTLMALIELFGRRRPLIIGLLGGAAFLTRAPLLLALPIYALMLAPVDAAIAAARSATNRWRPVIMDWLVLTLGFLPFGIFALWYNAVRFGSPLESGYGLASLPDWLVALRDQGLFSLSHLGMNIDYLFLHTPTQISQFPFFRPDGLGMSIFITSPGLFWAIRSDWFSRRSWLLLAALVVTLVPNLLYYGGGWLQYGYRYALDAIPFAMALCCIAAARHGVGWIWRIAITFGVIVGAGGVYWAYHL